MVLCGSTAGLTTVTLPSTSTAPSAETMRAGWPTFTKAACDCGMFTRAITLEISTMVSSGEPALAISPANMGRSATTPEMGLRISV